MSYLDPEKGHAKSEISASIGTESEAPQRPEILTTCRITSEVRHGCIIFRVYPNVHERRTPPTDNTRDSSKPVLHAVGATIYGTHAGPPIWIPELHDTSSAAATIPEGQPIRCFVASPAGATPTSSGTCSMLFETQYLIRTLPMEKDEMITLAGRGYQTGSFHRDWSLLELCGRLPSIFDSRERSLGLIRRRKGWTSGKCGHAAMNGYAPFELVDFSTTTEWVDTAELFGWVWRLQRDTAQPARHVLTCHERRDGPPMCRLTFHILPGQCGQGERHNEELFSTFELYEEWRIISDGMHNLAGLHWRLEKVLFHGVMLAEKTRRRQRHI